LRRKTKFSLRWAATIAVVVTLVLVSSAVAGIRYGHFHGDVAKTGQHVDLFVSPGSVRIGYVVRVHCPSNESNPNPLLGDFSGIATTLRKNGDFSFKRALTGSFRQITGNVADSKATVRIYVKDTVLGALCIGSTTFHARFVHA
jgi:hypothetical protein